MANPNQKKFPFKYIVFGIIFIVAAIFGYKAIVSALTHETTDDAQVETQITPVLPRVSGYVKTIAVNDYDSVQKGQLVVELDDAELQTQLAELNADYRQSEVDIENAKANLNNALVSLSVNKGNIEINKVKLQQATDDYQRDKNLYGSEAITKKQYDDSRYAYETAQKQLTNSTNDLATAESRVEVLKSMVVKSEAALQVQKARIDETQLKISYAKVYAPETGRIGKRNITEGQFVQAGTPLFSIVNDSVYWIVANFKENQIKKLTHGRQVDIELDAYPDLKLKGTIESLSEATGAKVSLLPPDNASGNFVKVTQRVPVKITINDFAKYRDKLRAGLSAYVSVPTNN